MQAGSVDCQQRLFDHFEARWMNLPEENESEVHIVWRRPADLCSASGQDEAGRGLSQRLGDRRGQADASEKPHVLRA